MFLCGVAEDFRSFIKLHKLSEVEEGGAVGATRGLLHVVGDDDDGEFLFQLANQLLDFYGRNRVECGAGFIHQENFGAVGDGTGDAEPLHLTAGEAEAAFVEPVLYFIPQRGALKAAFHGFIEDGFFVLPRDPEGVNDIFVDGFRKGVGFLENHAHAFAQGDHLDVGIVNAAAIDDDVPRMADAIDEVIHAIEISQERGFSTAGGPDKGGDLALGNVERDVEEGLFFAVEKTEVADGDEIRSSFGGGVHSGFHGLFGGLRKHRWHIVFGVSHGSGWRRG